MHWRIIGELEEVSPRQPGIGLGQGLDPERVEVTELNRWLWYFAKWCIREPSPLVKTEIPEEFTEDVRVLVDRSDSRRFAL